LSRLTYLTHLPPAGATGEGRVVTVAAFGEQCEGAHDGWRAAFFCVLDTTTGLHTHVCHLHRRLLHNEYPNAVSRWKKCQWHPDG